MNTAERPAADLVITGAGELVTPDPADPGTVRRTPGGSIAVSGERIVAVGTAAEVSATVDLADATVIDAHGGLVLPGFVDCHTHLLFGGSRAGEFAARRSNDPAALESLGEAVGIAASVGMTRAASNEELLAASTDRLDAMLAQGTTTVESKTGYGLDLEEEMRLLRLNGRLQETHPMDVISTFMGAHAFPPGQGEAAKGAYVDLVAEEMVPLAAEAGAEFNDVFCDEGYFTAAQARRILEAGVGAGLAPKIHADQYARIGAAGIAAELSVVSADHLNHTTDEDLERLAVAGVIGVYMPLIDFAVAHPRPVDARRWISAGLPVALATDLCPGGWAVSMPLAMQFSCRQGRLTPQQALVAATAGAAAAVGRTDRGILAADYLADIVVIHVNTIDDLMYRIGHAAVTKVVKRGRLVFEAET